MNGTSFLNYVLQVFKRTDKNTEIYTALADCVMDMRSRMYSDEHSEVATVSSGSLAVGDYKLALPTDFGHIIGDISVRESLSDEVYEPLKKISKQEFDQKYNSVLSSAVGNRDTGVPIEYCFYGRELYIAPPVDKTTYEFTINYTTEDEPTYTSATTSIPFTDQFREVVRAGVLQRMFREVGNYSESDIWGAVYVDGVMNIINNDDQNTQGSSSGINYSGV